LDVFVEEAMKPDTGRENFEHATRDSLTHAYNKHYLLDRLETDFPYAKRHQAPLTLLLFEICDLKKINDLFGAPVGDYVLTTVTSTLKQTIRSEDVLARVNNDTFAVLMRDVDAEEANMLAERLRQHIDQAPFDYQGRSIAVTVNTGTGTLGEEPDPQIQNPRDIVDRATRELNKARNARA
jgi:diguanylate cyclase (GGDEF)-like protein